ncbi:MAG: recombinase family protein [Eubacteriales bacterium]|nr:recombinase family protein [Eubacteriales bacterium]
MKSVAIYNCILTTGGRGHTRIVMNTLIEEANQCIHSTERIYGTDVEYSNYQDVGEFTPDNLDRPGFQRMLNDIKSHKIDIVVMVVLTKLSNKIDIILDFYKVCKEYGVDLIISTDGKKVMDVLDKALEKRN